MSLEKWKRQKYDEILFYTKLSIHFTAAQGKDRIPEKAIMEALELAKAEEWKNRNVSEGVPLSKESQEALAEDLLSECRLLFTDEVCIYLQKRIDTFFKRRTHQQDPETKKMALFYHYLRGHELYGKKKVLEDLGKSHGLSPTNFYQTYNAIDKNSNKNPKKAHILNQVIPMLEEYPEALLRAKADLSRMKGT